LGGGLLAHQLFGPRISPPRVPDLIGGKPASRVQPRSQSPEYIRSSPRANLPNRNRIADKSARGPRSEIAKAALSQATIAHCFEQHWAGIGTSSCIPIASATIKISENTRCSHLLPIMLTGYCSDTSVFSPQAPLSCRCQGRMLGAENGPDTPGM